MASLFQIRRGSGSVDLLAGELYNNQTSRSLQIGIVDSGSITLAKLNETNSGSFDISGDLFVSGNARIVGNLTFGDSDVDTVTVVADFGSDLIPSQSNEYNLGTTTKYWKNAFIAYITGSLSGSVDGINVTNFSTSVDSRLDYIETTFSTSVDSRLDQVESTASVLVNTFSASQYKNDSSSFDSRLDYFETTFSTSVDLRLDEVEASASYLYTTFSSSVDLRLDEVESTASFLVNTFSASQYNNDSSSFDSRLIATEETGSNHESRIDILEASQSAFDTAVVLDSTNVTILGNLTVQGTQTSLNTTEVFVEDLSLTLASGSLTSTDANGAGIQIAGADVTMSWSHGGQRIELNKDFAVTGSISSSTIVGLNGASVTTFSTSVDSRLVNVETTSSNFDGRLDNLETISASYLSFTQSYYSDSASFDGRTTLLETTASYLNTTFSTSVDSRLTSLEADSASQEQRILNLEQHSSSVNTYTASVSTSVGLLQQFSGSEYKNDSSSFDTRISASTLTFNDTTGQTAIDFTHVGTQLSAIASGLSTTSDVRFNNITASGYISSSKTIYCDTLVANTLTTSGSAVNSFTTNGTYGSVIIKDNGAKAITALENANFDDSTFSITGSFKVSGSISSSTLVGIGNVTEFSTSVDSRLDTIELSIGNDGSLGSRVSGLEAKTGSYATTGSNTFNGSQYINGDITASNLYISGAIYTYELHSIIESSSVFFSSGSNQIGDNQNDVLTITGSIYQTGSTLFSELSGSLFAFSASLNSRFNNGGTEITTLSSSIYQTDTTQSNNISTISASAWGAFQSASSYSSSLATGLNSLSSALTSVSTSVASRLNTIETTYATTGSNTFKANQIISGSLNVTGDVVAYSTSDERLKDNIQLISNPIQKVNELRGVEFDWKDGMPKAGQHDYGVIAQDVIKVMPELVNQRQDGYYAVDYDKMIGLLIEVVKEQEKRIKELENKIG